MGFEKRSNIAEKPWFRLAGKIFGFETEIKTDSSSQPASFEASCEDKKVSLNINNKFASLFISEVVGSLGEVIMKRRGNPEMASKIREKKEERRNTHEFGETWDKIEETLDPFADCLREWLKRKEDQKNKK